MLPDKAIERLPKWAQEMKEIFRGGIVSEFVIHGNVFDLIGDKSSGETTRFLSLKDFLTEVMFAPFDVVLCYNRGAGIKALKGKEEFNKFLKLMDDWTRTTYTGGSLPRDPQTALDLLDRFVQYSRQRTLVEDNAPRLAPLRTAVILEFIQFIAPNGDSAYMMDRTSETLIRLLDWASDPNIVGSQTIAVLVAENLSDVARPLVESPYLAKIRIDLPTEKECLDYLEFLGKKYPELTGLCEVPLPVMARKVVGLTRVNQHNMVAQAVRNGRAITSEYLTKIKKELIEKECYGLLEFIESGCTLDDVAGLDNARAWLRQDAKLIRNGRFSSLPMGYLMTGRIGTGKTWLANCWAGEVGIPFVALKNFRDRWMGATEGNLEKIFNVLHALGQVIVFVDEADQMAGKRGGGDSDGGVSGRIYATMAREMSDTRNRGKIIWIFATSRPDLLEVDLKRPGRLDVHIPLFPPQSDAERQDLFWAMARKVRLPLQKADLPQLPSSIDLGGNEMEAVMVRAMRLFDLQEAANSVAVTVAAANGPTPDTAPAAEVSHGVTPLHDHLERLLIEYRPMPYARNLEYMDLIAVKECTDVQFLPEKFRSMKPVEVDERLERLKVELRIS